jgi:hypothetical protein
MLHARKPGASSAKTMEMWVRKQLARLADEADMTMRAFVLDALKAKGLDVRSEDLMDLRKERR